LVPNYDASYHFTYYLLAFILFSLVKNGLFGTLFGHWEDPKYHHATGCLGLLHGKEPMPVETRPTSQFWYGRWRRNGRRQCKRLKVRVAGEPGSPEFDQSRDRAESALADMLKDVDLKHRPEDLIQRIHEVKFGKRIGAIPLARIYDEWKALPRKRSPSAGYLTFAQTNIGSFVAYVEANHPKIDEMAGVTPEMAEGFMRAQEQRGVSPKTYNEFLTLLRGVFERLRVRAGLLANPFKESLVMKDTDSIHRQPFTVEELEHLFKVAAAHDAGIYNLIVIGACTALRLGDCCCLKWEAVDLKRNRVQVKTRKTGENVAIPLFPRLRAVLEALPRNSSPYIQPALATSYISSPGEIHDRIRRVLTLAGFRPLDEDSKPAKKKSAPAPVIEIPDEDDMRPRVMAKIRALTDDDAAPRIRAMMLQIFELYSSGLTLPDIAKQLDLSKGSVSNYLARVEKICGHPVVRKEVKSVKERQLLAAAERPALRPENDRPLLRVNSRGFHALRATFATQALTAGVPVEVLKLITGHSVTETVLKHYFNPDEKSVFKAVETAMPRLLTGAAAEGETKTESATDEMLAIIDGMNARTWKNDAAVLRGLIAAL
jgi:integrase